MTSTLTTLTDQTVKYVVPDQPYVVLHHGEVEAVIVNHPAVDNEVLPRHQAGYSGLGSLKHARRPTNLFVPAYSGLNFEHIHDGTNQPRDILFEPRRYPVQLRVIDEHTAELYQSPTPHWRLESCTRYALLPDGTIEMTLQCVPRARTFANGYIGLFFASYINQPESTAIHFLGVDQTACAPRWIEATSPKHGVKATHPATSDHRPWPHDPNFSLGLVFNFSDYRYTEPWYYGLSRGTALAFIFRERDQARFSQSPSGGGNANPAWDFQWFIPDYQVGTTYTFVMRAMVLPFESPAQMAQAVGLHRRALR